ncbi:hypothetical protein ASD08_25480 [Streptomyces sp. Root369]|nr:hypothetical protein ASD08_25480 [Streptomyces sp. Root369]
MSTRTRAARWSGGSVPRASRSWRWRSLRSAGAEADSCGSRSCSRRSVSSTGDVLREATFLARSRQALTVIRCSQVVTADWPRNVCAAR